MPAVPHPGQTEIGFLSDLRAAAERIGGEVLGRAIRWEVEGTLKKSPKRPDVIIRWDSDGQVIANGEAKRPDDPAGVHPLVTSEVENALGKAAQLGATQCFTTNFLEIAVLNSRQGAFATLLDRVSGSPIPLISEAAVTGQNWWSTLSTGRRDELVESGMRMFFDRLQKGLRSTVPTPDVNEITLLIFRRTTDQLVADLTPTLLQQFRERLLPIGVIAQAKAARLKNLSHSDEARYMCAQTVAEVLTAGLFYRNIAPHFSLSTILRGTNPGAPNVLMTRIEKSLEEAKSLTGDYDTIFNLSEGARWALTCSGEALLEQWKQLFAVLDQLRFDTVTSDIIGGIFERLISPERRRAMGQHYTQSRLARAMTKSLVRTGEQSVADISCGAGTFLVEAYNQLRGYGKPHHEALTMVIGNDLDPFAVHLATVNLATRDIYKGQNYPAVRAGDAFDLTRGGTIVEVTPTNQEAHNQEAHVSTFPEGGVDICIGNPPYDDKAADPQTLTASLLALGGASAIPPGMKNGNLAAWFFLLAATLTKTAGTIALVMPAGVLQNDNLLPFRRWLRSRFDISIWHTEVDVWFSDARVAPIVLFARARDARAGLGKVSFVEITEPVSGNIDDNSEILKPDAESVIRDLSSAPPESDLLIEGTRPAALTSFEALPKVKALGNVHGFEVYSGNKLGNDAYKLVDRDVGSDRAIRLVQSSGLSLSLSNKYLTPLLSGPRDERTGEFDGGHPKAWVLSAPEQIPSGGALERYVRDLRRLRVHEQPSVAQRGSNWWSVSWRRANIAIQIHPGFEHQVWWSDRPFVANNNFHVITGTTESGIEPAELVAASAASAFGALSALYLSSEVGCEGVRWLQTGQLAGWYVLDPRSIDIAHRAQVLTAYREFRRREAQKIHLMSSVAEQEWFALTCAVARAAGGSNPELLSAEAIECAKETTRRRTLREQLALAGRYRSGGAGGSSTMGRQIQMYLNGHEKYEDVLRRLTGGPIQMRLRISDGYSVQEMFDFDLGLPGAVTDEENALTDLLGVGFEAAPILDVETYELVRALRSDMQRHFLDVTDNESQVAEAYSSLFGELDKHFRHCIRRDVGGRMN